MRQYALTRCGPVLRSITLMEHHHLHDCVDYDTGLPKLGPKRLKSELGLDIKGGPGGAGAGAVAGLAEGGGSSSHPHITYPLQI
jgi:hypothetical protein